jgi:hypothetical protein
MNWKHISEQSPEPGRQVLVETDKGNLFLGVVMTGKPSGFEWWCYATRHDGTMPDKEEPQPFFGGQEWCHPKILIQP